MSGFDEREKGQERKFAQDAELHFRARARRDKKLGLWIAKSFLDLEESTAEAYAKDLLAMYLEEKGDGNLIAAVLKRWTLSAVICRNFVCARKWTRLWPRRSAN